MDSRKVSVIMGIYNCADTLPTAIDSILEQTYTNWELIMCDDGSNDETYAVATQYVQQYPDKIRLIRHDTNQYLSASLNDCLKLASGYYVARMDGDDISVPERFAKQVEFLEENPEYQLVGSAMQWFNESGQLGVLQKPARPDKYSLKGMPPFNHATIMTYKSVYDALGGYLVSERTRRAQDLELWFRFYAKGYNGANLAEPLYLCREDVSAIKRRTFKVRFNAYKTRIIGYKMLGYPWHWYIPPTLGLLKSLIPSRVFYSYRKLQSWVQKKRQNHEHDVS